jgi:hypothetical protein
MFEDVNLTKTIWTVLLFLYIHIYIIFMYLRALIRELNYLCGKGGVFIQSIILWQQILQTFLCPSRQEALPRRRASFFVEKKFLTKSEFTRRRKKNPAICFGHVRRQFTATQMT